MLHRRIHRATHWSGSVVQRHDEEPGYQDSVERAHCATKLVALARRQQHRNHGVDRAGS